MFTSTGSPIGTTPRQDHPPPAELSELFDHTSTIYLVLKIDTDRSTESNASASARAYPYHHADHSFVYVHSSRRTPARCYNGTNTPPVSLSQTSPRSSPLLYPASMLSSMPRYAGNPPPIASQKPTKRLFFHLLRWAPLTTCRSRSRRRTTTPSPWP
jgi:hypothetical protein